MSNGYLAMHLNHVHRTLYTPDPALPAQPPRRTPKRPPNAHRPFGYRRFGRCRSAVHLPIWTFARWVVAAHDYGLYHCKTLYGQR